MARQGRRPKPTHLSLIDGNPGKRKLNDQEPEPVGDLCATEPPDWLDADQKDGWRYAISNAPAGMLKLLDRSMLTVWVVAESYHRKAVEACNRYGLVTKSPNVGALQQNPYLAIANKQAQIMQSASAELGFSPSSRSRVKIPESGRTSQNPFDEFARR
jgi:P27 family predicted phage terminase small subunit